MAAFAEAGRRAPDDVPRHGVTLEAAVAEDEARVRGDDERRVGHDQVEEVVADRLEPASLAKLELEAVEPGVERRNLEGAGIQIRGNNRFGVPRRQQRLGAATRSEIESASDRFPDRQRRERARGVVDASDIFAVPDTRPSPSCASRNPSEGVSRSSARTRSPSSSTSPSDSSSAVGSGSSADGTSSPRTNSRLRHARPGSASRCRRCTVTASGFGTGPSAPAIPSGVSPHGFEP